MDIHEKALACGYAMIDNDGLWDIVDLSASTHNNEVKVVERASKSEASKFIASKARETPTLVALAMASKLPLPELDCDPDAYGEDE